MKFNKFLIFVLIIVLVFVFASACVNTKEELPPLPKPDMLLNPYDKVILDDGSEAYYIDDFDKSFNQIMYEGDISRFIEGKTPMEWIDYVQSLKYVGDGDVDEDGINETDGNIFQNAEETIMRGKGDCEDLSLLMARGLSKLGVDSAVIFVEGHALCGISAAQVDSNYKGLKLPDYRFPYWDDNNGWIYGKVTVDSYYVIETTSEGWEIGEYTEKPLNYLKICVV